MDRIDDSVREAAEAIATSQALVIGAGAGMGVDSGLPDFRGPQGFWRAYPAYEKLGLRFEGLANPAGFRRDPELAWGFYGHRLNLYRTTCPHDGFAVLQRWGQRLRRGLFVYTSNVDGHFQRAGFDPERITEVHGSIHWLQCTRDCGHGVFPADAVTVTVDEVTMRARGALPTCPGCGALARPNILMFGDMEWNERRSYEQQARLKQWLGGLERARVVVVECGAGTAIPTVRSFCEWVASRWQGRLVRINLGEPAVPAGQIGLPLGAREALHAIDACLKASYDLEA